MTRHCRGLESILGARSGGQQCLDNGWTISRHICATYWSMTDLHGMEFALFFTASRAAIPIIGKQRSLC